MEAEVLNGREKQLWMAGYNQAVEDAMAKITERNCYDENDLDLQIAYKYAVRELKK